MKYKYIKNGIETMGIHYYNGKIDKTFFPPNLKELTLSGNYNSKLILDEPLNFFTKLKKLYIDIDMDKPIDFSRLNKLEYLTVRSRYKYPINELPYSLVEFGIYTYCDTSLNLKGINNLEKFTFKKS